MGVCHVDGRAFVADIDDTDTLARHVIPDRLDVAALEAENAIDAAGFEKARDPGRGGGLVGVEIDGGVHVGSEYRVLSTRCKIFPVAVRGMSLSQMNEIDRGRL